MAASTAAHTPSSAASAGAGTVVSAKLVLLGILGATVTAVSVGVAVHTVTDANRPAAIVVASVLGIAFYASISLAERYLVGWHPSVSRRGS